VGVGYAVGRVGVGEGGVEGGAEFCLHGLVGGEVFEAPGEGCGGCVVAGDEEAEDLGVELARARISWIVREMEMLTSSIRFWE
jgi:hypothetical protein